MRARWGGEGRRGAAAQLWAATQGLSELERRARFAAVPGGLSCDQTAAGQTGLAQASADAKLLAPNQHLGPAGQLVLFGARLSASPPRKRETCSAAPRVTPAAMPA